MFAASFNGNSISSAYDAVVEYKTRANDFFFFFFRLKAASPDGK